MASNYASIKLSTQFVDEARREAEVVHRSVGAQIEYWARIGRALENTPGVDIGRVREALTGGLRLDGLSARDQDAALDALGAAFDAPDRETRDHFARLGEAPGAVGTDGRGGVARRQPRRV